MSSDFAAAQQRVLARQQEREAAHRARLDAQRASLAASRAGRLPIVGALGQRGLAAWNLAAGREGTRPAYRVGQVDAELLDEELLELLKAQVGEGLRLFGPHLVQDWSAEILLALRAVMFKLSMWDHDASYGAALQGLRYTDARAGAAGSRPPSRWQKGLYGLFTVAGRYGWEKWESWLIGQEGGYEQPSRNLRFLSRLSALASSVHDAAGLASFVVFLVNGRYRTLTDRALRMRLAPPRDQVGREISFEYLNRQLVWHAFTEFLLFLLPLVGISRWRRWLSRAWKKTASLVSAADDGDDPQGELAFLPERTCAICYQEQNPAGASDGQALALGGGGGVVGSAQTDVTNPYEAVPCGCVYCFVCIATRLQAEEGEGFHCLRCTELVAECRPWAGDVVEETSRPHCGKSVSFMDQRDEEEEEEEEEDQSNGPEKAPSDSGYETAEHVPSVDAHG